MGIQVILYLLQMRHVEYDESVVCEQVQATDEHQVGKQLRQAGETIDTEEHQEAADLQQLREADVLEVVDGRVLEQHYLEPKYEFQANICGRYVVWQLLVTNIFDTNFSRTTSTYKHLLLYPWE